ncbi:uncharacterized protein LOC143298518 [Babylonia areolata]|uniref:uncharacterized protein LOC143298518 n=1 Tax=Babylonia areolata TaxID=304850 RepID=UPI003FD031C9
MASVNTTVSLPPYNSDIFSPSATLAMATSTKNVFPSTISPSLVAERDVISSQPFTETRNNSSLLFDALADTFNSSNGGGGESSVKESSAYFLSPSSSVFDLTSNLLSSSGNVSASGDVLLDLQDHSSGHGGEVISTTVFSADGVPTTFSPSPSSSELWGGGGGGGGESLMSSAVVPVGGGGTFGNTNDGGEDITDMLIIYIPVGVAGFIVLVILIVLCIMCCRRKKPKKEVKVAQDDLWVDPESQQVPAIPLCVLTSASDSEAPSSPAAADSVDAAVVVADGASPSAADPANTEQLYKAVYEFPGQLDSQLTLTPGDVIQVLESAEHGWLRGVIKGDNRSGWFPSSFVVPVNDGGKAKPEDISTTTMTTIPSSTPASGVGATGTTTTTEGGRPRISSFLIRKKPTKRPPQLDVPSLTHLHSQNSLHKESRPVAAVCPVSPVRTVDSSPLGAEDFSSTVRDKYFKALFPYKAAFRGELNLREGEMIVGKERDRNGWMLGRKQRSGEEGWFPAVYVDQVTGDVSAASTAGPEGKDCVTSSQLKRDVYSLLEVNRTKSPDQAWVAIEHRVTEQFQAESESQMSLRVGDVVAVVQALESGWCLGCHGDRLGWFPVEHVQLLEERSEGKMDSFSMLPLCRDPQQDPHRPGKHDVSSSSTLDTHPKPCSLDVSQDSILSEGDRHRPARKAPKAPNPLLASQHQRGSLGNLSTSSSGSQSINPRPARPAPAPPSQKPRADSVGSMDQLDGHPPRGRSASEAAPRKQRKPRVVRIPKERLGLDKLSSWPAPVPSRKPSLASCGSPPVVPPSGSVNPFFVKPDTGSSCQQTASPAPATPVRTPTSPSPPRDDPESKGTEMVDDVQPKEGLPDDDSTTDRELNQTPPGSERNEGSDTGTTDTDQDREDVQDKNAEEPAERSASSPSAASIAVQTDLSDFNVDDLVTKHPTPASSDREVRETTSPPSTANGMSSPSTDGKLNEDVKVSEEKPSPAADEDLDTNVEKRESPQTAEEKTSVRSSRLIRQNAEDDSDRERDDAAHTTDRPYHPGHPPQSETERDTRHTSPQCEEGDPPPCPTPKQTPPLPDLLDGAKTAATPEPLKPEPAASPVPTPPNPPNLISSSHAQEPRLKDSAKSKTPAPPPPPATKHHHHHTPPLVRPLSQKDIPEEGEEGLVVPPEGVSGRVHMIVHQINRMASVEERGNPPRKTSLQPLPEDGAVVKDLHTPTTSPLSSLKRQSLAAEEQRPTPPPPQSTNGDEVGDGGDGGGGRGRSSETADRHRNGIGHTDPSPSPSSSSPPSVEAEHVTQGSPAMSRPGSERRGSRGEGQTRRQSGRRSGTAPPPPTSPPPPLTRKSQRRSTGRDRSSEC